MIFTSFEFLLFVALVLIARSFARTLSAEKWLLLAASCLFYMSWNVPCVLLILFTALMDYAVGRKMGQTTEPRSRKRLLVTSLALNLGILGFFKYRNFFL